MGVGGRRMGTVTRGWDGEEKPRCTVVEPGARGTCTASASNERTPATGMLPSQHCLCVKREHARQHE